MVTLDKTCRTANGWDINGMGQTKDGRGNICPTTIIMPTLAMEAEEMVDTFTEENQPDVVEMFMKLLDQKIREAKDSLIERFDWICSQSPNGRICTRGRYSFCIKAWNVGYWSDWFSRNFTDSYW